MRDYHNFCTKDTPKEQRNKWNIGDIWINAVHCKLCDSTVRSKNRHDYVECSCGNTFVDGGSCYPRWGCGKSKDTVVKITEFFNDVDEGVDNR